MIRRSINKKLIKIIITRSSDRFEPSVDRILNNAQYFKVFHRVQGQFMHFDFQVLLRFDVLFGNHIVDDNGK